MDFFKVILDGIIKIVMAINDLFWGNIVVMDFANGDVRFELTLMILILIPLGLFFTVKSRFLPFRLFPEMCRNVMAKKSGDDKNSISGVQALITATATRVGMGNLAGVVAAVSFGGPGAVFWMWLTALVGSASAFAETTLAQIYKEKDPLYGGFRGGPAYFIGRMKMLTAHRDDDKFAASAEIFASDKNGKNYTQGSGFRGLGVAFAISALICWAGIAQVVGNSVTSAWEGAFNIKPLYTSIVLCILAALIVFNKGSLTQKVLDVIVPVMAGAYIFFTIVILVMNIGKVPGMFADIFANAFGFRQVAGGGMGAVIMNGVKRGLFSNEAGSGSAPCVGASADVSHPVQQGLIQALGVFIDTIVICSCTAFAMLLAPKEVTSGLEGMALLQGAFGHFFGRFGVVFTAVVLFLFAFSTFLGILVYARGNVAYVFGDKWGPQKGYQAFEIVMLFIGGMAAYGWVWTLGDVGIALMTVFNVMALLPLSGQVFASLKDYEKNFMGKVKK